MLTFKQFLDMFDHRNWSGTVWIYNLDSGDYYLIENVVENVKDCDFLNSEVVGITVEHDEMFISVASPDDDY